MSDVERSGEGEQGILVLSKDEACDLAKDFDGKDPFPCIKPALLSADHIIEYAKKTGMISPLFVDGNRMKKASYQGRIGKNIYEFRDSQGPIKIAIDKELVVKANSIVFVECDLDFRLPDFIAVRFNLHIRHVHRGLLLGTGPLVDPGYWGKLCIPLHNLTDNDYPIPRKKGLIWVEFTKISSEAPTGREPSASQSPRRARTGSSEPSEGRESSSTEFWEIHEFIERAAKQYGKSRVPIRSSIPVAVQETRQLAYDARNSSEDAKKSSNDAEDKVKKLTRRWSIAGIIGVVTVVISLVVIAYTIQDNIQSAYHFIGSQIQSAYHFVGDKAVDAYQKSGSNEKSIENLQSKIKDMEKDIQELHKQILHNQPTDTERRDSLKK